MRYIKNRLKPFVIRNFAVPRQCHHKNWLKIETSSAQKIREDQIELIAAQLIA